MIPDRRRLTHRFRRTLGPIIDSLARAVGDPMTRSWTAEYAGTARCSIETLEAALSDAGFRWAPVSLYHYTPVGTRSDGSWAYRRWPFAHRQLHAVLYEQGPDRIDCYAHEEYNWLRHPLKHLRHEDIDHDAGGDRLRAVLDVLPLENEQASLVRRKLRHGVTRLRQRTARPIRLR